MRKQSYRYLIISVLVAVCLHSMPAGAQDVSFSQMYASPMYLSPSFTGLSDGTRMSLSYRDQWPGIANAYSTVAFAVDNFIEEYSSGVGLMFVRDDSGNGLLVRQNISALYSYEFEVFRDIYVRPGIEFSYKEHNIDFTKVTFLSNISGGGHVNSGGNVLGEDSHVKYFDAATSAMIYSDDFWFGMAIHNMIKKDISATDIETYNPLKTSVYGGYKYKYTDDKRRNDEQSLTFAFNYRFQQDFHQLDFGSYWYINPMEFGLWYRGIPFASSDGLTNNDGLIFILGINVGPVRFAYSYDWTLSDLSGYSNGANELTLIYRFSQISRKKTKRGAIPCSAPGTSGLSGSKYRRRSRSIF